MTKPGTVLFFLIAPDLPAINQLTVSLQGVTVQLNCTHSLGAVSTSTGCSTITVAVEVSTQNKLLT